MALFPKLKTGAITQYPSTHETTYVTGVQRYVDMSEQRHRDRSVSRRRWRIKLSLLNETELATLVNFFDGQRGRSTGFDFEDPWSGTIATGCRFEQDILPTVMNGEVDSAAEFSVVEPVGT